MVSIFQSNHKLCSLFWNENKLNFICFKAVETVVGKMLF